MNPNDKNFSLQFQFVVVVIYIARHSFCSDFICIFIGKCIRIMKYNSASHLCVHESLPVCIGCVHQHQSPAKHQSHSNVRLNECVCTK